MSEVAVAMSNDKLRAKLLDKVNDHIEILKERVDLVKTEESLIDLLVAELTKAEYEQWDSSGELPLLICLYIDDSDVAYIEKSLVKAIDFEERRNVSLTLMMVISFIAVWQTDMVLSLLLGPFIFAAYFLPFLYQGYGEIDRKSLISLPNFDKAAQYYYGARQGFKDELDRAEADRNANKIGAVTISSAGDGGGQLTQVQSGQLEVLSDIKS